MDEILKYKNEYHKNKFRNQQLNPLIDQNMQDTIPMDNFILRDGGWIQDAVSNIKKRGTEGVCRK